MSTQTIYLNDAIYRYMCSTSLREPAVLKALRQETMKMPEARMQIAPEQGQFMALLVKMLRAKRVLEIGVFTGYSVLAMALALPDQGHIVACDINEDWTSMAKRFWQEARVDNKIDLHLRPATETLEQLIKNEENGRFDFAFIDADKVNYSTYYEQTLKLLRPGGVVAIDNVLWDGKVANQHYEDEDTESIRELNRQLFEDERVDISLVPIGDGLMLARLRE